MGCWYSKLDREQMISRCKARKRYMKQFVEARHAFSAAHSLYLRSLRNTGAALLRFATAETSLHRLPPLGSPPPPLFPNIPSLPLSPTTVNSVLTTSSNIRPPLPAPPPPPASATWDFWDPFMLTTGRSADEEMWNQTSVDPELVVTPAADNAQAVTMAGPTSEDTTASAFSEHAVASTGKGKDFVEIIQELDDYFLKAANAGISLSFLLDVPIYDFSRQTSADKTGGYGKSVNPLLWTWGSNSVKWNALGKFCEDYATEKKVDYLTPDGNATHRSTVERLYTWEKKLYQEVKNAEYLKSEHEKKTASLRKLEMKGADYIKTDKAKKEVEKLESQMMVSLQAIETISTEIIKLRETELYPQLLQLVAGLMNMWKSMHEFHRAQMHIVQRLKYLNCIPSSEPTSEIHRQSTLQLELDAQQWHISLCNLIEAQRDYIQSLTGWLRLSLFQLGNDPVSSKTKQDDAIYSFCEEWQLTINNAPEKAASEGLKSFLSVLHAIVDQQADELKQKRRSESVFKELTKKNDELRSFESKHGPFLMSEASREPNKDPVREKRAKVVALRAKAEDEKAKYDKSISITRASTMSNLQMALPEVFQAMTSFANSCMQAFESMHNQARSTEDLHNPKK